MGEELPFGGQLFFGDGTKFCEVAEIPEFIGTVDNTPIEPFMTDREFTFTFQMSPRSSKWLKRVSYGWKAKGPIRKRPISKVYDMKRRFAVRQGWMMKED